MVKHPWASTIPRFVLRLAFAVPALCVFAHKAAESHDSDIASSADWPYVNHDTSGTRYSTLEEINSTNANKLQKACAYTFPDKEPSQTAPIVVASVIYASTAHYTVALDGFDCHVLWSHKWEARGPEPFNTQRGIAVADGKIVRGTADGFLLSLDTKNGHLIWAQQIADPKEGYFISMPPLIHGDLIYVGPAGAEWAANGWVGAYRLSDGHKVWRFNIVPADGEPAADSWGPDPAARKHAGGNLWTALSFDSDKDLLYVPGGNPAPDYYDDGRPGANLYTNSLIALDAKTGRLRWYRQLVPHDVRDYDLTHVSPVIKTRSRTLIVTTGKDGLMRAVDRDTHEIVYTTAFTTQLNTDAPITTSQIRTCPGALGGNEWNGAAYSAKLDSVLVPATDWCASIKKDPEPPNPEKEHAHGFYFGGAMEFDKWDQARGWLTAFDASTGKVRWRYAASKPLIGAVTATAGNVVLTGELTGDFIALDARSGKILLRANVGDPIAGGVVTYGARGVQNVAVVSGYVGVFNQIAPAIGGGNTSVTVFRLAK
jgi:alcohol dehydrogenase (cytochrome c)